MTETAPLKPGWRHVKFGDVVRLSKTRSQNPLEDGYDRFVGLEHLEPGDLRVRRWGDVADGTTFTNVFKPGQVLFGKRRAYQRKVAVADFAGVCSGDIYVLESKSPQELLPELLPFICQTDAFFDHAVGTSAGSLSPRTNWGSLADFEFVLPSIDEQFEMLESLAAIEEVFDTLRITVFEAKCVAQSIQRDAFAQIFADPKQRLNDFIVSVVSKNHTDLPILSVTIDGFIVRRESLGRQVSDATGDEKYLRVKRGDLVYNTMRLWQGAVGIAEEDGLVSPAYTVLRPLNDANSKYFWYLLRSSQMIEQYPKYVKGVARDRWRIYYAELGNIRLVLPESGEMERISSLLQSADQSIKSVSNRIQEVIRLRSNIIAGRLGVRDV